MGCQKAYGRRKANGAPKKTYERQKANGAPKRQMDAIKGKWDAKKANGMPKKALGRHEALDKRPMGARYFSFSPDGGALLWISARWGREA